MDQIVELAHKNAIRGVEIFSPGTHNGDVFTEQDMDDMIQSFKDLDFRPALKVGHTKDFPGAPAFGFIANLRKAGGKLVADFEDMHDTVVQAIKERRYDRVSSEIYFNLKRAGKTFRRALKAVSLLGAEVPAVAGLKPLHKMQFSEEGFEKQAACEQSLAVEQQALVDSLTERVASLSQLLSEQKEQSDMDMKKLKEQKAALEAQIAQLSAKGDDKLTEEDRAKLKSLDGEVKALGQKIDEGIADLERKAAEGDSLRATVASLQAKDREREANDKVARCTVKSFHGNLHALFAHAVANPDLKVKAYSIDKEGKRTDEEKSLTAALDGLVDQINAGAAKLFVVDVGSSGSRREEGPKDGDAGAEVDKLAKARVADGKSKNYDEAVDAVLAADEDLKKRYHAQSAFGRYAAG